MKNRLRRTPRRALILVMCLSLMLCISLGVFTVGAAAQSVGKYSNMKVILGGIPFGVKFSTDGVVVVGFSDIDGISKAQNPAYVAGLRPKDIITKVNGRKLADAADLTSTVESSGGQSLALTYMRGGVEKTVSISPIFSSSENKYKTGVWIRDSGAGIGTVTFIIPETGEFGGLGHGICDGETGELIPMSRGTVLDVKISSVKKGIAGTPGELKGYFGTQKLGALTENTECGIYGKLTQIPAQCSRRISIGTRDELKEGGAIVVCTTDGGEPREYKMEITHIKRDAVGSKCFVVKITDPELIERTGGIVQGMSGSPIIQNGKLVGAVTHVLINDPTTGYGIFIENMLNAAKVPQARAS
jgi:stage IV sporulation protein B